MELVIDTASGALSVALIEGDDLIADHHAVIGRGHAETVVGVVARLVGDRGQAVTGIVCGVGPGSFTGVRIGLAAARALGLAWSVPVAGVGSLALVAAAAFAAEPAARAVVAVAEAGRGHLYWQVFDHGSVPRGPAAAGDVASVPLPTGALLAGTGAALIGGTAPRAAVTHPPAAAARWLPPGARGAARPLYLGGTPAVAA